mmetsp:Transcript_15231/g.43593  ORF Transcript_15231/g.43593 Transcript_15231/m.43593 type:complete len:208 (+) Transcript_15231:1552-2175(+)
MAVATTTHLHQHLLLLQGRRRCLRCAKDQRPYNRRGVGAGVGLCKQHLRLFQIPGEEKHHTSGIRGLMSLAQLQECLCLAEVGLGVHILCACGLHCGGQRGFAVAKLQLGSADVTPNQCCLVPLLPSACRCLAKKLQSSLVECHCGFHVAATEALITLLPETCNDFGRALCTTKPTIGTGLATFNSPAISSSSCGCGRGCNRLLSHG